MHARCMVLCLVLCSAAFGQAAERPNVVFIMVDDVAGKHADVAAKARKMIAEAHVPPLPQLEPPAPEGRAYR